MTFLFKSAIQYPTHFFEFEIIVIDRYNNIIQSTKRYFSEIWWCSIFIFIDLIDLMQIFNEIIGKYWDPERKLVDEGYTTIPPIPYSQAERFVIFKAFSDTNFNLLPKDLRVLKNVH